MNENIYTILVNKENKIQDNIESFIKLVPAKDTNNKRILIEEKTYLQYQKLQEFISKKENLLIGIENAYRTANRQKKIYEEFILCYGKDYADSIVAPVNCSEHQTGLAIDLELYFKEEGFISNNKNFDRTRVVFEKKVHKYLYEFGFILRYPKNKEDITKYPYEPWHIRYVGEETAKEIFSKSLTLEEYIDIKHKEKGEKL